MAYMLITWVLLSIICGTVLYLTRQRWTHHLPVPVQDFLYRLPSSTQYSRVPQTFMDDAEAGMHSADFDLAGNIGGSDSRTGLDPKTKQEIQRVMKVRGVNFDEARRIHMQQGFKKGGIGKDGLPDDPKLVTFS